jgi:hypothetical protein
VRIVVRIDRLVLEGLPLERRDRAALEAGLRSELMARLLAADGPRPVAGLHLSRVAADPVHVSGSDGATGLGVSIGRSVHGAIGRGERA